MCLKIATFVAMNKKEKLIKRFKTQPRDFTFEEVVTLFQGCGFTLPIQPTSSRDI
jgi:hypothetical protein